MLFKQLLGRCVSLNILPVSDSSHQHFEFILLKGALDYDADRHSSSIIARRQRRSTCETTKLQTMCNLWGQLPQKARYLMIPVKPFKPSINHRAKNPNDSRTPLSCYKAKCNTFVLTLSRFKYLLCNFSHCSSEREVVTSEGINAQTNKSFTVFRLVQACILTQAHHVHNMTHSFWNYVFPIL